MLKRVLLASAAVVLVVAALASVILWYVLSDWVPVKGKALIIETVERHAPVDVSIGTVRYDWLTGMLLTNISLTDRATQDLWASAPLMHVRVSWTALLAKQVAFNATAPITAPCDTMLAVSGRYHQRDGAWTLEAQTDNVDLGSVTPVARRRLPEPLTAGLVRLRLHADRPAEGRLSLDTHTTGTGVVWSAPSWQLAGNVELRSQATPPPEPGQRWAVDTDARLQHGTLQGVPVAGSITDLDGEAHITGDRVRVTTLTGKTLGSAWQLEGDVRLGPAPSVEALVQSDADIHSLITAILPGADAVAAEGTAALRAVCRGPVAPRVFLDCLVAADVHDAGIAGPFFPEPVRPVNARLAYDALSKRLTIASFDARSGSAAVSGNGEVVVRRVPYFDVHLRGDVPLALAAHWSPKAFPLQQLQGRARFDLRTTGEPERLVPVGRIDVQDADGVIVPWSKSFERLSGSVLLDQAAYSVEDMRGTLDGVPLNLSGSMSQDGESRVSAAVGFPNGRLRVSARPANESMIVDEATLELPNSRVRVSGTLARDAAQPSRLAATGTLRVEELALVPFLALPALDAWKLRGAVDIDARLTGALAHLSDAAVQARLRSAALQVREFPLEDITCTIDQQDRVLRARVPSALAAGGPFTGELTLDQRLAARTFLTEFDLVNMQLARLAKAIPAWRDRQVTGQASTHAILSGTWDDRSSWRGEGWLNATGEGLGDLPLLDKLFRGLFGVLADRMGLDTLRRAHITQGAVQWRLAQERIHTDNLRLAGVAGAEPVAIYATGSVGLDQTLDLTVEPELSEGVVLEAPTTASLATTVLRAAGQLERLRRLIGRHRLTGTIKQPEYRFELSSQDVIKQLAPGPADFLQHLFDREP